MDLSDVVFSYFRQGLDGGGLASVFGMRGWCLWQGRIIDE
jgi:hypothetical protein